MSRPLHRRSRPGSAVIPESRFSPFLGCLTIPAGTSLMSPPFAPSRGPQEKLHPNTRGGPFRLHLNVLVQYGRGEADKGGDQGCVRAPLNTGEQNGSSWFRFASFGLPARVHSKAALALPDDTTGCICQIVLSESRPGRRCFLFGFFLGGVVGKILRGCSGGDVNTVCVSSERWSAAGVMGPF